MAWEDDSTLEFDVYLSNGDTSTDGYVSKAVGGYAVESIPEDKQQSIILPKEAYDLGKTAVVEVAREDHLVETRHSGHTQTGLSG